MKTNFEIYDVISYIVPGAIAFIISLKLFSDLNYSLNIMAIMESEKVGNSIVALIYFLFVSFLLGQILQIVSTILEKKFTKRIDYYDELKKNDNLRKWVKEATLKKFAYYKGFDIDTLAFFKSRTEGVVCEHKEDAEKVLQLFSLYKSDIAQSNLASKIDIFNRQYSFYRSLMIVSGFTAIISLILLILRIDVVIFDWFLILGGSIVLFFIFQNGYKTYSRIYVKSVYENFILSVLRSSQTKCKEEEDNLTPVGSEGGSAESQSSRE
ncbi:hypothetical protein [Bacillus sp. es.036]|uniref:hypothetical protein n=1 Tax=Bacillus sp. es.036 TaxID=1761764 RepID=UPI000BF83070|nr:hypothetical protein [Bacillus sp. es.036]PFG15061.1 hypothetical protein ATG70_3308 [Bacillus sp. es.036]